MYVCMCVCAYISSVPVIILVSLYTSFIVLQGHELHSPYLIRFYCTLVDGDPHKS